MIVSTALRQNPLYLKYYVIWSKLLITEIFPYLTILILNIFIIYGTLRASSFREQFVDKSGHAPARRNHRLQSAKSDLTGKATITRPSRTPLFKLKSDYIEPSSSSAPFEGETPHFDGMSVVPTQSNHLMNQRTENGEGEMTELKEILVLAKSCSRVSTTKKYGPVYKYCAT